MHKHLNELGIKSDDVCIFNTEHDEQDPERERAFFYERQLHRFDSRETWSLDYTSATWVYEHLKMYKELAGQVVNLHHQQISIPVLHEIPHIGRRYYNGLLEAYYKEVIEIKTLEEAIDLTLEYLEYYLLNHEFFIKEYDSLYKEQVAACKTYESLTCAFKIYAIILEYLWW